MVLSDSCGQTVSADYADYEGLLKEPLQQDLNLRNLCNLRIVLFFIARFAALRRCG
jgi:hypothetical protein